jgi:hypothetical protein
VTQSLGGTVGAWALAIGGYIASSANPNPVQPENAIIAIKFTIGLLPAIAALLAMLIFIKYPLNDKMFRQIRDETEARKLAAIEAHHERPEDFVTPDHKGVSPTRHGLLIHALKNGGAKSSVNPSAIVGWVRMASRKSVYFIPASIAI